MKIRSFKQQIGSAKLRHLGDNRKLHLPAVLDSRVNKGIRPSSASMDASPG